MAKDGAAADGGDMTFGPLFVLTLVFCVFAAFDWQRLPFCARASLGAAMVFAIAGFQYPGADLAEVVAAHRDGFVYMVELARAVGFATVLVSLLFLVRGASQP
jgi:hypothetical protein